jgi:hypothetical protein
MVELERRVGIIHISHQANDMTGGNRRGELRAEKLLLLNLGQDTG